MSRTHRRLDLLQDKWVLCCPHRAKRPWQGQVEEETSEVLPQYDPRCYLCPGNMRSSGTRNPEYTGTFVFENDFAALKPPSEEEERDGGGDQQQGRLSETGDTLFVQKEESGVCRVVCFSPRHDVTLAHMDVESIAGVVRTWQAQFKELGTLQHVNHVQIFENKGAMMGCSNPHPHCQVWAQSSVPDLPQREVASLERWHATHGVCLLCAYVAKELQLGHRLVYANSHFVALVPYWAVWPFEVLVLPRRHATTLLHMEDDPMAIRAYAQAIHTVTVIYDNLFRCQFPYSSGIHQAPTDGQDHPTFHWHMHFAPPLLRSATVKKHMVGYELMADPQRDMTAEVCAAMLRKQPRVRFHLAKL